MEAQRQLLNTPKGIDTRARVLVADDQPNVIDALELLLKSAGIEADRASSPEEVSAKVRDGSYDLLLMDMNYARDTTSGLEGLQLLSDVKNRDGALSIVVMTAWSTVPIAVAALQKGAHDFIEKPWDNAAALKIIEQQITATRQRRRKLALERAEVEEASEVQKRLMGSSDVHFGRFSFAAGTRSYREVGGDYFDLLQSDKGRVYFCVADVMGKGVGAALLMANLQAQFRIVAQRGDSPAQICQWLNTNMLKTMGPGRLVSLICASLDTESGELDLASAGHPAATLVRADSTTHRLSSDDAVLGSFSSWAYRQQGVTIRAGERVVLLTDGFLEAEDERGDELGEERVARWSAELRGLGARDLQQELQKRMLDFCGGRLKDDATLMVVACE
jgi:sigma-B regulation protein RsbU (phosphoserine phosphatase)